MEAVKGAVESAKQAAGLGAEKDAGTGATEPPAGTAHKTAAVPQTGAGVVGSVQEAGHRAQEQQGADNPGFYNAQAKLVDAVQRGNEKLSGSS